MMTKTLLSRIGFLVLSSAMAHGAILTESVSFGSKAVGSSSFVVPLHQFDASLGMLTSITLSLDTTTAGSALAFDNEATSPGTVNLEVGANVMAKTGINLITTVAATPFKSGGGSVTADNDGTADFTGTDSFSIAGGGTASQAVLDNTSNYLSQFTTHTHGLFYTTVSNAPFTDTSTSGVFGPTSVTGGTFSGKVTVTYTYTPLTAVPEVSGLLWGALLCGYVGFRRVRRNSGRTQFAV